MKNKLFIGLASIALASMLIIGCSKEPKAEIDAVKASLEKARIAGADIYLQKEYIELKDSVNVVLLEIQKQNSKTIQDFTDLKGKLIELTILAQEIEENAKIRKEEISTEIETTMNEVTKLVDENGKLLLEISKANKNIEKFTDIENEQKAVKEIITESDAVLKDGNYMATLDKVKIAKEKALSINKNLQELISKDKTNAKSKKTS